jgi:hypothetical protein
MIVGQLEAKIDGQPEKNIRVRLEGCQETRRKPAGHELRDIRQHFAIRGLVTSTMRCAEEDETQCRIADRLVPRLEPCVKQSLEARSVTNLFYRDSTSLYLFHDNLPERVRDEYKWTINLLSKR